MTEDKAAKPPGVNPVQVAAGALAAVSSAVLLSTLGVAGTIIGAALGSVFASVGATLYSRGLAASQQRVANRAAALRRVAQARAAVDEAAAARSGTTTTAVRRADGALEDAEQALGEAEDVLSAEAETDPDAGTADAAGGSPKDWFRGLPWKRVAIIAAAVFVAAMLLITAFEVVAGRSVSQVTGGSDGKSGITVPGLGDAQPADDPTDGPEVDPTAEPTPDEGEPGPVPSETPTTEPSAEPTESAEPTAVPSTAVPSTEVTPTAPPVE